MKLLVKEGMTTPDGADKMLFNVAPIMAMVIAMLLMAPIAFAERLPDVEHEHRRFIYLGYVVTFCDQHPDGRMGQ